MESQMKNKLILILTILLFLNLSGCGDTSNSDTSADDKVIVQTIELLSKVNSYELTTSRVESTAFGDKQLKSQTITEQKIIFEPFVSWARTNSTSSRTDGSQQRSLQEVYQAVHDDQLDIYIRYSPAEESAIGNELVVGEWEKISTVPKEQADWFIDWMRSNFDAQLYLLSSNIKTFTLVKNDEAKDENILRYDGYLEQTTILEAYQKYIRNTYVKGSMLEDSKDMSLEDLKNEIIDGDLLEIKAGLPKLVYSEKSVPISLWIDKSTFELKKVAVDETLVMQAYMEKELPKENLDLDEPVVDNALLIYEMKSLDDFNEVTMPD